MVFLQEEVVLAAVLTLLSIGVASDGSPYWTDIERDSEWDLFGWLNSSFLSEIGRAHV